MTHDHIQDYEIISAALNVKGLSYLGLIGSNTKWKNFSSRLTRDGFASGNLEQVTCPIGHKLQELKEPSAVAAVIAAEIFAKVDKLMSQANEKSKDMPFDSQPLPEN